MSRLTLKEAISHAKEVAEKNYRQGMLCHANPNDEKLDKYIECGREHEQLAGWLEELQRYEDLEEQLEELFGGKLHLDKVVETVKRVIQNNEEKLDYARILTNAEAEKWDKWKELEEQGLLIEINLNQYQRDDLDRCTHRHCNNCDKYRHELQKYKNLEEQGKLIELPCLPNEEVWLSHKRFGTHKMMYASREAIVRAIEAGNAIGYTKEAAEAKLKEMESAE